VETLKGGEQGPVKMDEGRSGFCGLKMEKGAMQTGCCGRYLIAEGKREKKRRREEGETE